MSSVLLAGGVVLVCAGMSAALDFSIAGIAASVATIAGLLYAGAVWFGGAVPADATVLLFDRRLLIVSGGKPGQPIAEAFPSSVRRDLEERCRDAFDGRSTRFSIPGDGEQRRVEVAPVRTGDGLVAYGILLSGRLVEALADEELTPLA